MKPLVRWPTEDDAISFLESKRWPFGVHCPKCNSTRAYKSRKGHSLPFYCRKCTANFSVKTETVFQGSRIDLRHWLFAIHLYMEEGDFDVGKLVEELGMNRKSAKYLAKKVIKLGKLGLFAWIYDYQEPEGKDMVDVLENQPEDHILDCLVRDVEGLYSDFFRNSGIDPKTGYLMRKRRKWKFSTYPHIGSRYGTDIDISRVMFYGLNVGYDMKPGSIWSVQEWRNVLEPEEKVRMGFSHHMAGTYFAMLRYGCPPEWGWQLHKSSDRGCKMLLQELGRANCLPPDNPLKYIAFSNVYKWALQGSEDTETQKGTQKFLDKSAEIDLILDEISLLGPDIVIFQSSRFADPAFGPLLKAVDHMVGRVYVVFHPSIYEARTPAHITQPLSYSTPAGRYGFHGRLTPQGV